MIRLNCDRGGDCGVRITAAINLSHLIVGRGRRTDNLLFAVTAAAAAAAVAAAAVAVLADFESAEFVRASSDFHASHAFTAFTAGIDITWTKAGGREFQISSSLWRARD